MVGANQNVNGSHDLTTPPSGMVCYPWTSICHDQPTKFEVSISTHHVDMIGDTKCRRWGGLGYLGVIQGHWK